MALLYRDGACPPSVTSGKGIAIAAFSLLASLALARVLDMSAGAALMLCVAAWAVPLVVRDLAVEKVHRRPSTGLDWTLLRSRPLDLHGLIAKLAGMVLLFAALGAVYASLPDKVFQAYHLFAHAVLTALPVILALGTAYIWFVHRAMVEPRKDGLYEFGMLALLRYRGRNWGLIRDFVLGWIIKGFFLPQMFGSAAVYLWRHVSEPIETSFVGLVLWVTALAVLVNLIVAVCGYALTCRPLDAHIRSPNPFLLAWLVCLTCYFPFNMHTLRVLFPYNDGLDWNDWFAGNLWLAVPWGFMLVTCYLVWSWATIIYGLRWSNLTHRGIVTNGPYRFLKHPDYTAKSAFWWLSSVPFLSTGGWTVALWHSLLLVGVNIIYFLRAKTEERHLRQDPAYEAYLAWIDEHGLLGRLRRFILGGLRMRDTSARI